MAAPPLTQPVLDELAELTTVINVIDPSGFRIPPTLPATKFNEPLSQTRRTGPDPWGVGGTWPLFFLSALVEEAGPGRAPGEWVTSLNNLNNCSHSQERRLSGHHVPFGGDR